MALKFLRSISWTLKGALLVISLVLAIIWAWSYWLPGRIERFCWFDKPYLHKSLFSAGCGNGRMGIFRDWEYNPVNFEYERPRARRDGPGWQWQTYPGLNEWYGMEGRFASGPFRWQRTYWANEGSDFPWNISEYETDRTAWKFSVRCWVPTALASAWPLASLTLLTRRRLRARHLARIGRCPTCNYDLRATPARCPECGATFPDPNDFRWLKTR
jgi:hypothetical protein